MSEMDFKREAHEQFLQARHEGDVEAALRRVAAQALRDVVEAGDARGWALTRDELLAYAAEVERGE